jgi:hypothetical protein
MSLLRAWTSSCTATGPSPCHRSWGPLRYCWLLANFLTSLSEHHRHVRLLTSLSCPSSILKQRHNPPPTQGSLSRVRHIRNTSSPPTGRLEGTSSKNVYPCRKTRHHRNCKSSTDEPVPQLRQWTPPGWVRCFAIFCMGASCTPPNLMLSYHPADTQAGSLGS